MNLNDFLESIDKISNHKVSLVAVSKYVGNNEILNLHTQGQIDFGENKVQDLVKKSDDFKELNLNWHFIGNLQTNKINALLRTHPTLWQSCNSLNLAIAVDKRLDYTLDTLLEINIADEKSKNGANKNEAIELFHKIKQNCKNINLKGIMCMGANSDNEKLVAKSFENAYKIYSNLTKFGAEILSMGMSGDYEIAIKNGSNMIRVGSLLFAK
ncbi:YggS family pyridoxal phosphate-dependent enzyme [Campylobacter sp. FMV-PI01]|uniref:Pyridoxal phosphate homeostasis protein n=1 Tax=Campylobacter portucalensis TaxID=2608384 RepID=A0A6L5WIK7_9BACT|nr:YggS family pyridoxal phosphate-dependent enzyme [Campylobacter portucalensis]MSN96786.1 YggS family pyridoxal phosphate-dependent enzyme [Campylobacter portucalensis]